MEMSKLPEQHKLAIEKHITATLPIIYNISNNISL